VHLVEEADTQPRQRAVREGTSPVPSPDDGDEPRERLGTAE
jgi:hypothetical protein